MNTTGDEKKIEGQEGNLQREEGMVTGCHDIATASQSNGNSVSNGRKCYDATYNPYSIQHEVENRTRIGMPSPLGDLCREYEGKMIHIDQEGFLSRLRLVSSSHWLWKRAARWNNLFDDDELGKGSDAVRDRTPKNVDTQLCSNRCMDEGHVRCPSVITREAFHILTKERVCNNEAFLRNARMYFKGRAASLRIALRLIGERDDPQSNLLGQFFEPFSPEEIIKDVKNNFYSLFFLTMNDEFIDDFSGDRFWHDLYYVRNTLGLHTDYGYKEKLLEFTAQGDDENKGFFASLKKLWSSVKGTANSIYEVVKAALDKLWKGLKNVFGFVSGPVTSFLGKIKDFITKLIVNMLTGVAEDVVRGLRDPAWKGKLAIGVMLFSIVIMTLAHVLTENLVVGAFKLAASYYQPGQSFEAQSNDPVEIVTRTAGSLFGLNATNAQKLKTACIYITTVMAGGTALYTLSGHLFALLPTALKTAIIYQWGSKSSIAKYEVQSWCSMANAVLQVSKVPCVLRSESFFDRIKNLLLEGTKIMHAVKEMSLRSIMLGPFVRLGAIAATLTQYKNTPTTRKHPFSVHFFGPPGIGKTLVTEKLATTAFEIYPESIYTRNVNSDYWDGCADPNMIVMDEFMVGDAADKLRIGKEYLTLVSTGQFQPQMASVDNPTVGIKGTVIAPSVIWTMNNDPYFHAEGIPPAALNRRRHVVIEMSPSNQFRGEQNKLDISRYSREELSEIVWAKFRIHPSMSQRGYINMNPWLTYGDLIHELKNRYDAHNEACEAVAEAMGGGMAEKIDPEALINEALRQSYGLPGKVLSIKDALMSIMGFPVHEEPEAKAEAPWEYERKTETGEIKPEGPHIHLCCGLMRVHKNRINDFTCTKCNKVNPCNIEIKFDDGEILYTAYDKKIKTYAIANHEGKHNVIHAHKCAHADCVIRITHRHEVTKHEPQYCEYHGESEPEYASCNTVSDSDGSMTQAVARYKCWYRDCHRQVGGSGLPAGPKFCSAHKNSNPVVEMNIADLSLGNIDLEDEDLKLIKFDEDGNVTDAYFEIIMGTIQGVGPDVLYTICSGLRRLHPSFDPEISWKMGVITGSLFGLLTALTTVVNNTMSGEEEETLTFGAESDGSDRESYTEERGKRSFKKGKDFKSWKFHAESKEVESIEVVFGGLPIQAYPLGGKTLLTFFHGVRRQLEEEQDIEMTLYRDGKAYTTKFIIDLSVSDVDSDLFIFNFEDRKLSPFPNNLKKFILSAELGMIQLGKSPVPFVMNTKKGKKYSTAIRRAEIQYGHSSGPITVRDCWRYAISTENGDCGSVLVASSGPLSGKIIGMHVAGTQHKSSQSQGLAVTLNREDLEAAFAVLNEGVLPELTEEQLMAQGDWDDYIDPARKVPHPAGTTPWELAPDGLPKGVIRKADAKEGEIYFPEWYWRLQVANDHLATDTVLAMSTSANDLRMPRKEIQKFIFGNLNAIEIISKDQMVHTPTKTKITKTVLHGRLSVKSEKEPAILSRDDPRSAGRDPALLSMFRTLNRPPIKVDEELVREVFDDLELELRSRLKFPHRSMLTFRQACEGIPGLLSSLKMKTSAGYPLFKTTKAKGKQEFIWFDDEGNFHYDPEFEKLVENKIKEMSNYSGDPSTIDHVFIGYLKDELVSPSKIQDVRTRMIYSNDLICLVAFRMLYGPFIIAMQNSPGIVASIGINQYSHSMNRLFDQLTDMNSRDIKFIDGDICEWDYRMIPQFQEHAYNVIGSIASEYGVSKTQHSFMVDHETKTPMQVSQFHYWTKCNQASGCFWTTILNCLVNEGYVRYLFSKTHPGLRFEDNVRMCALGDDHIIAVTPKVNWTPKVLGDLFAKHLDQQYTSSIKGAELEDYAKKFSEITYLGAHPVIIDGLWCGASKKSTIFQTLQWCKKGFEYDQPTIESVLEYASVWGSAFYYQLYDEIKKAIEEQGLEFSIVRRNPVSLAKIVASRTSGDFFHGFTTQAAAPQVSFLFHAQNDPGLVTATTQEIAMSKPLPLAFNALANKAVNAQPEGIEYGLESEMYRGEVEWTTSDQRGDSILRLFVPQDILGLGNVDNLQNMAFARYIFMTTDVEMIFEITGQPSLQGKLIVWEAPLSAYENTMGMASTFQPPLSQLFQMNHVTLEPNKSSTQVLKINYKCFRSAINTFTFGDKFVDYMGSICMTVVSTLRTIGDSDTAIVTLRTRFPNARFAIPRPIPEVGKTDIVTGRRFEPTRTVLLSRTNNMRELRIKYAQSLVTGLKFVAEGANSSTINNVNNVVISDVAGSVPYQGQFKPDNAPTQSLTQDVSAAIPMHNPPLVGGAVPTYGQLPSISRAIGVAPTHALQLHPQEMHRQTQSKFNNKELSFEEILKLKTLQVFAIGDNTIFWNTTQTPGTVLWSFNLDSTMHLPPWSRVTPATTLSPQWLIMNSFTLWKCESVEMEIEIVKTKFHAGKLMVTVGYGTPATSALDRNVYISRILDFSDEMCTGSLVIPWTAGTEWLRTLDYHIPSDVPNPSQDYSMGVVNVSVLNQLRANDTVPTEVEMLIYLRINGFRVYEPKSHQYLISVPDVPLPETVNMTTLTENDDLPEFHAQNDTVSVVDQESSEPVAITAQEIPGDNPVPMELTLGEKFEYTPKTVLDVMRRFTSIMLLTTEGWYPTKPTSAKQLQYHFARMINAVPDPITGSALKFTTEPRAAISFLVKPRHELAKLYAAWAGHMKYRFVLRYNGQFQGGMPRVAFFPVPPTQKFSLESFVSSGFWPSADVGDNTRGFTHYPQEHVMALPNNTFQIDVQVPFTTHFNMLATSDESMSDLTVESVAGVPVSPGFISIDFGLTLVPESEDLFDGSLQIYEAVGDDFILAHMRPALIKRLYSTQQQTGIFFNGYDGVK